MVTRKAFVRPILWHVPQFRRRSKTSATNCARRCSVLHMKDKSTAGAQSRAASRRNETRAKRAGRTKMTRSLSNTFDVRRCNFRCAHRAQGNRTIRCRRDMIRIARCDSRRRVPANQVVAPRCEANPPRNRAEVVTGRAFGLTKSRRATRRDPISPNKGCLRATIVA